MQDLPRELQHDRDRYIWICLFILTCFEILEFGSYLNHKRKEE